MKTKGTTYYLQCFANRLKMTDKEKRQKKYGLTRDHKNGGAPHKPILLLAIMQAVEEEVITSPQVYITPELVLLFKQMWVKLVTSKHDCRFPLPFYHLRSEPFWVLTPNIGCEVWIESKSAMRNFGSLNTAVAYALMDKELFQLFQKEESRELLRTYLLSEYFPHSSLLWEKKDRKVVKGVISNITTQILEETPTDYQDRLKTLKKKLKKEEFEEEVIVRSATFKREVPKIYRNTCAISGHWLNVASNTSMIDACHIIPFSESYNDSITNGIALTPTLHRAFDRGLFTLDNEYKVIVSTHIAENVESRYALSQFHGQTLYLPENPKYHPSHESLLWHRNRQFEGWLK